MLCAAIVVAGMMLRAWLWLHYFQPARVADNGDWSLMFVRYLYYPTYSRLDGLLAGVALAACSVFRPTWMARVQRHGNLVLLLGVMLLAASIDMFTQRFTLTTTVVGYPLLSLALMVVVAAASGGTSWLARFHVPGANGVASISYSLYLCHKGIFHLVQGLCGERLQQHGFVLFGIYAVATLAGGAVLHYLVERPFLRWRDRGQQHRAQPDLAGQVPG
jgi:peptidoglycan/LPS O-acetylase OafA/YrhL